MAMVDRRKKVGYFGASQLSARISREAYASDASIYRVLPGKVICPRSETEAVAAVAAALQHRIPITPRGAGTGLAGGALGTGYVIDCSRLTQISRISTDPGEVVCQTGIIYHDLNLVLKESGLHFPPDPSSGDSCQVGGMLANNSSGPHSIKYGLTSDYVEELTVVGKDGVPLRTRKFDLRDSDLAGFLSAHPEYEKVLHLLRDNRDLILGRWPRLKKNSAGYNLRQVVADLDRGIYNLPALYVGSEGTLGLFLTATLRLLPIPEGSRSFRLFFPSLEAAGDAVRPLLDTGPTALEIVDGATLDLIGRAAHGIPAAADAMLMIEYEDDLERREEALTRTVGRLRLAAPLERAADERERQALWAARKAIVPTLYRHHAIKRPIPLIEDASLPVDKLTEYISWARRRLEAEHLTFGMFGHIGDGNLHIRPLMDLSVAGDLDLAQRLYHEVYEKMFELGGSSTAEHADGRLRAPVVKRLYGEEIYGLFQQIKSLLDPAGLFNPDVILSARRVTDQIDLTKLELVCAACGKCNGYCPAFEVFRREDMSPRGWLRMMKFEGRKSRELASFYQYCLNCKNCTSVCPAGVDIAGDILACKAEHPHPNAGRVISLFDRQQLFRGLLRIGAVAYPLLRTVAGRRLTAAVGGRAFGFDTRVELPQPAGRTLRERHPDLCAKTTGVAMFHGCADNYFASGTGDALVRVFGHYGWPLALPRQYCCGLPMEVYGHRENMIQKARLNIDALERFEAVVFTCASCLHRVADYHDLFEAGSFYHNKALALKEKLFDVSQYLRRRRVELPGHDGAVTISYHHPCHLRAAGLEMEPLLLLGRIDGVKIVHPDRAGRCCGQAGSFGFTHYREGAAIFDAKREEYRRLRPDIIVSSCPSCISKIRKEMGAGIRVCHPVEIIADLITGGSLHGREQ